MAARGDRRSGRRARARGHRRNGEPADDGDLAGHRGVLHDGGPGEPDPEAACLLRHNRRAHRLVHSEGQVGDAWIWSDSATGALEDDSWQVSFDYWTVTEEGSESVGSLTAAGSLSEVGEPMDVDDRFKEGNTLVKVQGWEQFLGASGAVTGSSGLLDELAAEPLSCKNTRFDLTYWWTNPATRINRGANAGAHCSGADWELMLDVFGTEGYATFIDGIVRDEETGDWISYDHASQGALTVDGAHISGRLRVVEPKPTGDPEYVEADLWIGQLLDSGTNKYSTPRGANHVSWETYTFTGTLTLPGGEEVVEIDCTYTSYTYWERYSEKADPNSKAGQNPGGKPPVNDLPENALTLLPGASSRVNTRGAAELPEAPCTVTFDEESWDVPLGRTIWYEVQGTGADVFLSTAGTDFDTVMGVYDTGLNQLACVDDTDETGLQASLMLPTEPSETYLVQVGGIDGLWGTLVTTRP